MTLNHFKEHYQTISNTELLAILDTPEAYQELAVEAAREEWNRRALSAAAIHEARQPLDAKKAQKMKQVEKVHLMEAKITSAGKDLLDTVNPLQTKALSTERTIHLIVIVLGGILLFQIIRDFSLHIAVIKDLPVFPMESMMHLLPLLTTGIGMFLFWKRKRMGWKILIIFFTFSVVTISGTFLRILTSKPSGLSGLERILPQPDPLTLLVPLLFFAGGIGLLCKPDIKDVYQVNNSAMISTIATTTVITTLLLVLIS